MATNPNKLIIAENTYLIKNSVFNNTSDRAICSQGTSSLKGLVDKCTFYNISKEDEGGAIKIETCRYLFQYKICASKCTNKKDSYGCYSYVSSTETCPINYSSFQLCGIGKGVIRAISKDVRLDYLNVSSSDCNEISVAIISSKTNYINPLVKYSKFLNNKGVYGIMVLESLQKSNENYSLSYCDFKKNNFEKNVILATSYIFRIVSTNFIQNNVEILCDSSLVDHLIFENCYFDENAPLASSYEKINNRNLPNYNQHSILNWDDCYKEAELVLKCTFADDDEMPKMNRLNAIMNNFMVLMIKKNRNP